ncbi:MAG: COX15/CtaA family protein, partial [Chloroflexi bacterium]|nr:COX15/CtaA family protein [Chloroflexota bacterium]
MKHQSPSTGIGTGFRSLLLAGVVGTFALVTLGGVVRVTESGLGCPDWPLCHGKLLPPLEFHVLVEYSHRLVASLLSAIIVLTAAVAWWKYRHDRRVLIPVTLALGFLGVEVALGGVAVLAELPPTIVTAHLAISQAIFALLLFPLMLTWPQAAGESGANESPSLRRWALGGALG